MAAVNIHCGIINYYNDWRRGGSDVYNKYLH